ncbi:7720_t:CDS:1, partial [Dentiscutata heterogama]
MDDLQDQYDLNTIIAALRQVQQDNQALHQENEALRITVDQLATQNPNDFKQTMPKISLPDKFNRSHMNFRGFLNQIRLIIRLQPQRYPNDATQVGLLGSLLTGSALAWFAPLLEKSSPLLENFDDFVEV